MSTVAPLSTSKLNDLDWLSRTVQITPLYLLSATGLRSPNHAHKKRSPRPATTSCPRCTVSLHQILWRVPQVLLFRIILRPTYFCSTKVYEYTMQYRSTPFPFSARELLQFQSTQTCSTIDIATVWSCKHSLP